MRVLGVDPGLTRCGIGVVDGGPGSPSTLIDVSVIRTPSQSDLSHRLLAVSGQIEAWLDRYRPDAVAIERVFAAQTVVTVIGTAQVTGVVALAAARRGLPVAWHTPSEVKAAVSGNGSADKKQVTAMVTRLLRLDAGPKPADAADALALCLCHLLRSPLQNRLRTLGATVDPALAAGEATAAPSPAALARAARNAQLIQAATAGKGVRS